MARVDKKLERWANNTPKHAPKEDVLAIIERFFSRQYKQTSSSHIVIQDDRLGGYPECGPAGDFTVVISGGQKVKGHYLRRLAQIIRFLEELKNEKGFRILP